MKKTMLSHPQFYKLAEGIAARREDIVNKCHNLYEVTAYMKEHISEFNFTKYSVREALELHNIVLVKPAKQGKGNGKVRGPASNARRTLVSAIVKLYEGLNVEPSQSLADLALIDLGKYPSTYKGKGATTLSEVANTKGIAAVAE